MSEEEKRIQEAVEKGLQIQGEQEDIKNYQLLFRALKEDDSMPVFSSSFADKVADRIEERAIAKSSIREYIWKIALLLIFLVAAVISLFAVDIDREILKSLTSIKWYIIITILLLLIIDFADKKLVKKVI